MVYQIIPSTQEYLYRKVEHAYKSKSHNRRETFYKDKHLSEITNGNAIHQIIVQFFGTGNEFENYYRSERSQLFCLLSGLEISENDTVILDIPYEMIQVYGSMVSFLTEYQTHSKYNLYLCCEVKGYGNQWRKINIA